MTKRELLKPQRGYAESMSAYRARRAAGNDYVKRAWALAKMAQRPA